MLSHPKPDAELSRMTNASDFAVGAVLQQKVDNVWQPLGLFSKRLQPAETRYSTFGGELLAVYLSIRHFRHHLEGRQFFVLTDHKPLTYALPSTVIPPEKFAIWIIFPNFPTISAMLVADALSRITTVTPSPSTIDFDAIAVAQLSDEELNKFRNDPSTSPVSTSIPRSSDTHLNQHHYLRHFHR